mgnify:CR=1 FL=1
MDINFKEFFMMKLFRTTITVLLAALFSISAWADDSGPKATIESNVNNII